MMKMKRKLGIVSALLFSAAVMLPVGQAVAQTSSGSSNAAAQADNAGQSKHYSKAKLKKFVSASRSVARIRQKYAKEIQNTQDKAKAQSLQQEAGKKMVAAVKDSGITPKTYNEIARASRNDQELRKRIMKLSGQQGQ